MIPSARALRLPPARVHPNVGMEQRNFSIIVPEQASGDPSVFEEKVELWMDDLLFRNEFLSLCELSKVIPEEKTYQERFIIFRKTLGYLSELSDESELDTTWSGTRSGKVRIT